jgi:hypothetical protein
MQTFHRLTIAAALVVLCAPVRSAHAQERTPDELRCQAGRARRVSVGLIAGEASCLRRCYRHAARAGLPPDECRAPFSGRTLACTAAVEHRTATRLFGRACTRDCPECYPSCGADTAASEIAYTTGQVHLAALAVYCGPGDRVVTRCQDTVAKLLPRFAAAKALCLIQCHLAGGNSRRCDPTTGFDQLTSRCIDVAATRSTAAIDRRCEATRGGAKPACFGPSTGASWVQLVAGVVDAGQPVLFCSSPSGAFVER